MIYTPKHNYGIGSYTPIKRPILDGTADTRSELWLDQPSELYLVTGNQTPVGTTVGLQSVPAGSELKFRIDVLNTGYTYYSTSFTEPR